MYPQETIFPVKRSILEAIPVIGTPPVNSCWTLSLFGITCPKVFSPKDRLNTKNNFFTFIINEFLINGFLFFYSETLLKQKVKRLSLECRPFYGAKQMYFKKVVLAIAKPKYTDFRIVCTETRIARTGFRI
jgi:hypothetical protein